MQTIEDPIEGTKKLKLSKTEVSVLKKAHLLTQAMDLAEAEPAEAALEKLVARIGEGEVDLTAKK